MRTRTNGRPAVMRVARIVAASVLVLAVLVAFAVAYEAHAAHRDAERFPAPGRLVDVGGRRLHLSCVGEGSPTVLFEAGGTNGSTEYASIQENVGKRVRACTYDRAGMGWSDPSPRPLDADAVVRDLETLLERAGVRSPYVLVAGSAGGVFAELFARRHREQVVGLLFLDALHGSMLDTTMKTRDAEKTIRDAFVAQALAHLGLLRFVDPYHLKNLPPGEQSRGFALKYHAKPWDSLCSMLRMQDVSASELRAAPPLAADVPLVVVTHDPALSPQVPAPESAWRAAQEELAASSTRGKLVVAERSGHHPERDRPELVKELLNGLLDDVALTSSMTSADR